MAENQIFCSSCGAANAAGARFCFKCGASLQAAAPAAPARPQSDFITLSCPNCGGRLEITPDIERFACKFCGNEHIVRRTGSGVSLAPVVEGLKRVETKFDQVLSGSDRLAAEQTIQRLKEEIQALAAQVSAKEQFVQGNSTKTGSIVGSIICMVLSLPGCLASTLVFGGSDEYMRWMGWCVVFFAFLMFLGGLIWLIEQTSSKTTQQVQKAKAELAQLRADLQNRRQQLEQLHRYTAER
jgi:predicted RNA-binding Zn-ribbon protein involved in translation (DUF1610 family)